MRALDNPRDNPSYYLPLMNQDFLSARLQFSLTSDICPLVAWAVNSVEECYPHTVEVAGSSPARPTIRRVRIAHLLMAGHCDALFQSLPVLGVEPVEPGRDAKV